ncbi:SAM-dependent methyltransferase [Streptomyces sp. B6B3]|uniref:SAM-dependent methyltransferase n=1 Tax=Streptomyces sp. B6B3 TaxID=3153570 RepID=UPI00325E0AF6
MDQPRDSEEPGARPNSARIWGWWLGNEGYALEADRVAGRLIAEQYPVIPELARAARAFHERVVRHMATSGLRQILDIGVGMPLPGHNTHELAQAIAPDTRVVYVDNDDAVLAHHRELSVSTPQGAAAYVHEDVRDVDAVLARAGETLDLSRPVGLTLMSMLGHLWDVANDVVRAYVHRLPSGSWLALCDTRHTAASVEMQESYAASEADPYIARTLDEIQAPVRTEGLELLGNGFLPVSLWQPTDEIPADADPDTEPPQWGFVARKP